MSRLSLGVGILLAVVVAGLMVLVISANRRHGPVEESALAQAFLEFVSEARSRGETLPLSVTPEALVRSGHLRPEEAKAFAGVVLVFHTGAVDSGPQVMLAEAQMPDDTFLVVLADGSVQHLSRARYEDQKRREKAGKDH